jgi:hypothetical protein
LQRSSVLGKDVCKDPDFIAKALFVLKDPHFFAKSTFFVRIFARVLT